MRTVAQRNRQAQLGRRPNQRQARRIRRLCMCSGFTTVSTLHAPACSKDISPPQKHVAGGFGRIRGGFRLTPAKFRLWTNIKGGFDRTRSWLRPDRRWLRADLAARPSPGRIRLKTGRFRLLWGLVQEVVGRLVVQLLSPAYPLKVSSSKQIHPPALHHLHLNKQPRVLYVFGYASLCALSLRRQSATGHPPTRPIAATSHRRAVW